MTEADAPRVGASPRSPLAVGVGSRRRESERDDFYDHLLHVCLLLLLQDAPCTRDALRDGLRPLGFEQTTMAVASTLEFLLDAGLVRSSGADAVAPTYTVTSDGTAWLRRATSDLRRTEVVLGGFLARCGERLLSLT